MREFERVLYGKYICYKTSLAVFTWDRNCQLRPTHTRRDWAMRRDFLVFKTQQICSLENFIKSFITFQLLDSSSTFHIYQSLYCRPIYLLWKNEKSRCVAESRPV